MQTVDSMSCTLLSNFGIKQIFDNWPLIAVFVIFSVMMMCHLINFRRWLAERRIGRDFEKFEASLLTPDLSPNGSRFLSGETKLPSDTTIHLPQLLGGELSAESLANSIDEGLRMRSLGQVIRYFQFDEGIGIDTRLTDFVCGVDFLRDHLLERNAPLGTTIEYEHGDMNIHE